MLLLLVFAIGLTPFGNFAMIARKQDLWHFQIAEDCRLGVLGVLDIVAIREALNAGRGLATQNAWQEAHNRINNN